MNPSITVLEIILQQAPTCGCISLLHLLSPMISTRNNTVSAAVILPLIPRSLLSPRFCFWQGSLYDDRKVCEKTMVPVPTLPCWHPCNFYRDTTFTLRFVLSAKYNWRQPPANCFKELVTTQLLLSHGFSSPHLRISIMSSGSELTGTCLDLVCTHLVQFNFSWDHRGCGFLGSGTLPTHLSDNLCGHCSVIFEILVIFEPTPCACSLLGAICGPALCSAQPAPVHLHCVMWTGAHDASAWCLWERRPRYTGAVAGPRMGRCPLNSYSTAERRIMSIRGLKIRMQKAVLCNCAWLHACL